MRHMSRSVEKGYVSYVQALRDIADKRSNGWSLQETREYGWKKIKKNESGSEKEEKRGKKQGKVHIMYIFCSWVIMVAEYQK